jgi:hypothetical protein
MFDNGSVEIYCYQHIGIMKSEWAFLRRRIYSWGFGF